MKADMMTLLSPVGRLVQGSMYKPRTQDWDGNQLVYKTGENKGQPRNEYYCALAVKKGAEKSWSETNWGQKIVVVAQTLFPGGQWQKPDFAWKVSDGDDTEENMNGNRPCEQEGFAGHWILKFSNGYAPQIVNENGSASILEKDAVLAGDYIQIAAIMKSNGQQKANSGLFLNHTCVAFVRHGVRIFTGIDPKNIGFGVDTVIPAEASEVPVSRGFTPPVSVATPAPVPTPAPYAQILTPPPAATRMNGGYSDEHPHPLSTPTPVPPKRVMLPKAGTNTYEQFVASGWTDIDLIQHGYMQA